MSDRRIIDDPDFPHGTTGYGKGCNCDVCREANRVRIAAIRARKRADTDPDINGPVAQTVRRELKEASALAPPWVQTLHELALRIAGQIDAALMDSRRASLVPALTAKLLVVLDRIRPGVPGKRPPSPADDVEAFVNGLHKMGQ